MLGALLAAVAFGLTFVFVGLGGHSGSQLWVAAGLQSGGLLSLLPVVLAGSLRRVVVARSAQLQVVLVALLIAAGDGLLALGRGDLATVSVLGSLDSVVSVVLAQFVLGDRLVRRQGLGVVAALAGALLLGIG